MTTVTPTAYSQSYGARVRQARVAAGLTQAEFGEQLGGALGHSYGAYSRSSIANIEAGRQASTVEQAWRITQILDCDPGWLLTGGVLHDAPEPKAYKRNVVDNHIATTRSLIAMLQASLARLTADAVDAAQVQSTQDTEGGEHHDQH